MKKKFITYIFVVGTPLVAASPFLMDFLGKWEGNNQNIVYADKLAGGLPTVCKGITKYTSKYPVIVGEHWSDEKCEAEEERIVIEIQMNLARCIIHSPPQRVFDMFTSHALNVGWPSTCASQTVKALNRGDIQKACEYLAFKDNGEPNWSYVGNTFIQGLFNRRKDESKVCLEALS